MPYPAITDADPCTDPDCTVRVACTDCNLDVHCHTIPYPHDCANCGADSYPIADTAPDSGAERY